LNERSAAGFEEKLVATLKATHLRFSELFEREERLSSGAGSLIFTGVENDKGTLATLSNLGFKRPSDISDTVRRWHTGSLRATRSPRARRIMTISPFLGRELSKRAHLIEALLESRWPQPAPSPDAMRAELEERLDRAPSFETKLNAARRWGSEHRFETAAQLAIGHINARDAATRFTAQADVAINALLPVATKETEALHGAIDGGLVVIGMGRLGAGAMTAASDVDLVFVYEAAEGSLSTGPKPVDAVTYFMRLVRRFLTTLTATTEEGALYEVDMQLRPSGSKGPWAVSLATLERYYAEEAWTWEAMALTKARIIGGDERLAAKVRSMIDGVLARPRLAPEVARDVEDMRLRVRKAKPAAGPWDVKLAEGGLTELEFILAFLNLKQGAVHGAPPPGALDAMQSLLAKGAISRDHAGGLFTALELFETIMQLSRAATGDLFSPDGSGEALQARMAAACGASTIAEAEEKLMARQQAVRTIYEAIVIAALSGRERDPP
jgi:glutamate-ammonia-ligase adenylyltransferase